MISKILNFGLAFIILAGCECGDSTEKSDGDAGDDEDATATSSDGGVSDDDGDMEDPDGGEGSDSDFASSIDGINICGNGVAEGVEECDDGDFDQRNGCTTLCEYSCTEDSDCNDMNPCNGDETCDEDTHACDDSVEGLEEGDECGDNKSCWEGACVFNVCGDGKPTGNEVCDDGNLDPDDGCTPDCEYTCEDNSDCSGKDECLGDRLCENHACVGGTKLDDKTPCEIRDSRTKSLCGDPDVEKDGWCLGGVCTCTDCGDGETQGAEDCDDGELNGTPQSPNNCSINCRIVECQNGKVEGDEECDDGNDQRLDGCDDKCKFEFAHRWTSLKILKGVDVPEWCVHRGNRFSEAFAEAVDIMGLTTVNILDVVNTQLSRQMATGSFAFLFHVLKSDDISMKTADDEIELAMYQGYPYSNTEDPLDRPFVIQTDQVDPGTRAPAENHSLPAMQTGGGRVISREPATMEMIGIAGEPFLMYGVMTQLVFDLENLSTPNAEPLVARDTVEVSDELKVPEFSGRDPQGLLCGAMEPSATDERVRDMDFAEMQNGSYGPMASFCCRSRGPERATKYRSCEEGDELGVDCDSISLLIQQGCTVCIDLTDISSIASVLEEGSNCDLMDDNPEQCFKIINGIDFDVDSDNDGEYDTWSVLFGFDAIRARIYDVALPGE